MKIIIIHSFYQKSGGEDQSALAERKLLQEKNHEVIWYDMHNSALSQMNTLSQAKVTLWNHQSYCDIRQIIRSTHPDIIHIQNTFPLVSPSVIHAAHKEGLPIVMTLRNYRLLCPAAVLFRDGQVCEKCASKIVSWPGVWYGCWRGRAPTSVIVSMQILHHLLGTWKKVNKYIAVSEFTRQKFIEFGWSPDRIVVKPNFVHPDPGVGAHQGNYALFVGRLSPEKGIRTLLSAWQYIGREVPLKIVGDGPLASEVKQAAQCMPGIEWMGHKTKEEVLDLMGDAQFLVFPSEWYETFGRVAMEAFARGTPVLASNIGAIAELIHDKRTGLLFQPGNAADLASCVKWIISHPTEHTRMRREARREFEERYTSSKNYQMLMDIYQTALQHS